MDESDKKLKYLNKLKITLNVYQMQYSYMEWIYIIIELYAMDLFYWSLGINEYINKYKVTCNI